MPVKLTGSAESNDDEARIEVIPLIDIMFFLLAAFMLVSLSMTHVKRVPIQVPQASSALSETREIPYQIAINAAGVISWEGKIVTPTEITDRLKASHATADTRVLISADEEARHKQVLAVLNAIRAAGVEKVSFETRI